MGIKGNLGKWIHSFLHRQYQWVAVNETLFEKSPVRSSIPQGSVLGPFLFLALISDIDTNVAVMADLTSIFITSRNLQAGYLAGSCGPLAPGNQNVY
ncbi:hypothetical protein Pcinc_015207 [Petrolisthes cinctipes]|uniref:Reverse transcriptase domain-containing protein n=1 Tax=Petrolisthes cinctipes TaxID=88211 RepID=A0AAE1KQQ7_PETCI|nr:hypothetical protein Pcinc_015207 [Petrolisthes cinctipes]